MEIVQKKGRTAHTFTFGADRLNFACDDKTGSGDFDIAYADCPLKTSVLIERNEALRNLGLIGCALGALQIRHALYAGLDLGGRGFWLLLGVICLLWAYHSTVRYSVLKTERGNLFVIQGRQHDDILDAIRERRRGQLLGWYGEVDTQNPLDDEIRKFNWLHEQQALSREEADRRIAEAELAHRFHSEEPHAERLN